LILGLSPLTLTLDLSDPVTLILDLSSLYLLERRPPCRSCKGNFRVCG
jgi:hypothetical protein